MHACTKSNHLQACIEPCPSIDCCCRLQECYPWRFLALHRITAAQSTRIRPLQSHSHLFKTCSGTCNLVGVTYSAMQHGICSTPTVDFSSAEYSIRTVNYSVVILKVRQPLEVVQIGTKVITRTHWCKGQQSAQLKVADLLLKPPRNNSRHRWNVQTELKSTVPASYCGYSIATYLKYANSTYLTCA